MYNIYIYIICMYIYIYGCIYNMYIFTFYYIWAFKMKFKDLCNIIYCNYK